MATRTGGKLSRGGQAQTLLALTFAPPPNAGGGRGWGEGAGSHALPPHPAPKLLQRLLESS